MKQDKPSEFSNAFWYNNSLPMPIKNAIFLMKPLNSYGTRSLDS